VSREKAATSPNPPGTKSLGPPPRRPTWGMSLGAKRGRISPHPAPLEGSQWPTIVHSIIAPDQHPRPRGLPACFRLPRGGKALDPRIRRTLVRDLVLALITTKDPRSRQYGIDFQSRPKARHPIQQPNEVNLFGGTCQPIGIFGRCRTPLHPVRPPGLPPFCRGSTHGIPSSTTKKNPANAPAWRRAQPLPHVSAIDGPRL